MLQKNSNILGKNSIFEVLNGTPFMSELINDLGFEKNANESRYVAEIIDGHKMLIKVEACGYNKDDIKVTYSKNDRIFEIKGNADKKKNRIQRNIDVTIDLPEEFTLKSAAKKIENGLLIIDAELNVPTEQEDRIII